MNSFRIASPVYVGQLAELLGKIDSEEVKHILLLSSPTVRNNNIVVNFVDSLSKSYQVSEFCSVKPNAPISDLDALISEVSKPDLLIAIGGGSVLDSAKALSLGWQGPTINELFYNKKSIPGKKIILYAVPSTAGTGAELSYGAILYDVDKKIKSGIRSPVLQPDLVLIDIGLYQSAPSILIAEVGFDCLTHAIETYLSTASTPLVRYQSIAAIRTVFDYLIRAVNKEERAIEKMALASTLMGINLALSTTCLPHRIQYAVGPATGTSHAQGLIILYRGWLIEICKTNSYQMLTSDLGLTGNELAGNIQKLKTKLGIDYTLGRHGVTKSDVERIASNVTGNLGNDPCYRSEETIISILKNSL